MFASYPPRQNKSFWAQSTPYTIACQDWTPLSGRAPGHDSQDSQDNEADVAHENYTFDKECLGQPMFPDSVIDQELNARFEELNDSELPEIPLPPPAEPPSPPKDKAMAEEPAIAEARPVHEAAAKDEDSGHAAPLPTPCRAAAASTPSFVETPSISGPNVSVKTSEDRRLTHVTKQDDDLGSL